MTSEYGKDNNGTYLVIDGSGMWVNNKMLFATIMAIVTALDSAIPEIGDFISVLSEKIYDNITETDGSAGPSGADDSATDTGSEAS